jgi:hypothetical protein
MNPISIGPVGFVVLLAAPVTGAPPDPPPAADPVCGAPPGRVVVPRGAAEV